MNENQLLDGIYMELYSFYYLDLVALKGFCFIFEGKISCRHFLCPKMPVSPLQPANNQLAATCIHSMSTLFKCPSYWGLLSGQYAMVTKPFMLNGASALWSHQQIVLWYLHRTSVKRCLPRLALHWPFFLCVLHADVKVSVSPARKSSRYD